MSYSPYVDEWFALREYCGSPQFDLGVFEALHNRYTAAWKKLGFAEQGEITFLIGERLRRTAPHPEWTTETRFYVGDTVKCIGVYAECVIDHKSDVFGNDVFNKKYWKITWRKP